MRLRVKPLKPKIMNKIKNVKETKDGGMRYNNVRIEKVPTENFKEMVMITKASARLKSLIGKKYINLDKAVIAIDVVSFDNLLSKRRVDVEMMNYGIVPME